MATISAGSIVADVAGDGPWVVMVHGLGGTSNTFQPQLSGLSGYKVVRPDLPGSGRSPVPFETLSIESFAESVVSLIRMFGSGKAHLVGHSLGTIVCQRIAVDHPDLVASLTLFGALTEPPDTARAGLIERAGKARAEGLADIADGIVANTLAASTRESKPEAVAFVRESLMRQSPEGYARTCEALSRATAVDARMISAPTLLVTGDADPVAPVSMAQALADKIAGAALSTLDRCGHWATIEKAQECTRLLTESLGRNNK